MKIPCARETKSTLGLICAGASQIVLMTDGKNSLRGFLIAPSRERSGMGVIMKNVKNRAVIRRIADRTRRSSRAKSIVAVLAIALTAAMFTVVFMVGGSLMSKTQEETMRQVGGSAHAGYKYLTKEEYDRVKKDKWLQDVSYRILVGNLADKALKKLPTEVDYFEPKDARWSFCYPTEGHMPYQEDEVVTSDLVLEALGVECRLGERLHVQVRIGDRTVEQDFTLCGYYIGDTISMAQPFLVSEKFQEKYAPVPTVSAMDHEISASDYTGRIMADFNFYISIGLKQQARALSRRLGFPEDTNIGINWAYLGQDMDIQSVLFAVVLTVVILLSGYLIIYNIFYISVSQDIAHYGLLKTVGTTGKQLRAIVRRQAYILSLYGIPLGIVVGIFVARFLLPIIMDTLNVMDSTTDEVVLNGWFFAGAAAFSFMTVYISCIKPCRVASSVTPIEAVRYTEGQDRRVGGKGRNRKRTGHVTAFALALQNVKRNRMRVVIVVSSLSLALVVLDCVYNIVHSFSLDKFVSTFIVCDYSVQDAALDNAVSDFEDKYEALAGVPDDLVQSLLQWEGIARAGNIYAADIGPAFNDKEFELFKNRILSDPAAREKIKAYAPPEEDPEEYIDNIGKKDVDGKIYGMAEFPMELLSNVEGDLSWERFRTGGYVIATRMEYIEGEGTIDFFEPGEKVHLSNGKGRKKEYEVLAVADIPYAMRTQWYSLFDCDLILPEEEYLELMGPSRPMRVLFDVEEGYREEIGDQVERYCTVHDPDLDYNSKDKMASEYSTYVNMLSLVGNLLVAVLACIGILNFVNTMVTSILSRKRELAMMEAVGMTGGQIRQMLMLEGGCYAFLTTVISLILGTVLSIFVLRPAVQDAIAFDWRFSLMPIAVCIPWIVIIVLAVPIWCLGQIRRVSVADRCHAAQPD